MLSKAVAYSHCQCTLARCIAPLQGAHMLLPRPYQLHRLENNLGLKSILAELNFSSSVQDHHNNIMYKQGNSLHLPPHVAQSYTTEPYTFFLHNHCPLFSLFYHTMTSSCLQHVATPSQPCLQHFNIMYAGSFVMEDSWIGCNSMRT